MHKSGRVYTLSVAPYEARIVEVGAGLASLTFDGRNIVVPHDVSAVAPAHLGKILAPWPNRLAKGAYTFAGRSYQLPISDLGSNSAIHGLLAWKEWHVVNAGIDELVLQTRVTPVYGYPFEIEAEVRYFLCPEKGLSVKISLYNRGDEDAPAGIGQHPYLCCADSAADDLKLTLPCNEVFTVDENLNPRQVVPVSSLNLDYQNGRLISQTLIDHTFKCQSQESLASIQSGDLKVSLLSNAKYLQVYTADKLGRVGVAIEPMTCPPNAFNSGIDLAVLRPKEQLSLTFSLSAQRCE